MKKRCNGKRHLWLSTTLITLLACLCPCLIVWKDTCFALDDADVAIYNDSMTPLDPVTGATRSGALQYGITAITMPSLAHDKRSSSLWGADAYTDQLHRISAKTGLATAVASIGVKSISDIFVHQSSGKIYGAGNGLYSHYLYTLDEATGMATKVASRQISGLNALGLAGACSLSLSAPTLTLTTSGTTVTVSWTSVPDADGYILHYAPYPDVSYINGIDMGTKTGGSFVLWDGASFYVAVKSYNSSSYSDYSNIEHFVILPNWINSMGQAFVLIPPGTFYMGSPEDEPGRDSDETLHQVTLTKPYYLQTTEVTQAQWETVMGNNPSFFAGCHDCPVESVSWADVQAFISNMNALDEGTYRLPTDAEWEYACRAGSNTSFYWGNKADCSKANYGNFWSVECEGSNPGRTMEVGSFAPNAWGLYDMSGNVWERCQDWYSADIPSSPAIDPTGPSSGSERVDRGGGWNYWARGCRCANRAKTDPTSYTPLLGFRLVRDP